MPKPLEKWVAGNNYGGLGFMDGGSTELGDGQAWKERK